MIDEVPLTIQTVYADLLDRSASAAFSEAFSQEGVFTPKTVRGRRYWYFQRSTADGRTQRYVGPETPEILARIAHHKETRDDQRDRQALVSTLVRSAYLPRPLPQIGEIVAALAKAGVFRLRGVLVGTVAYQTYSAMLGVRLPSSAVQTGDVDIAQFANISVAVEEKLPAMLEVLKEVNASFRPVPHIHDPHRVTAYEASGGLRVEFLTPNIGPDTDEPEALPALGTDAQRLRFLDYLIRDPEPAVLLHGAGIYILVPAPQRFAIHKLIVSRRRTGGSAKRDKDIRQAEALFQVLSRKRSHELRTAWAEAYGRGKTWRLLLGEGLGMLHPAIRDQALNAVDAHRSIIPGLDLKFAAPPARYDFSREIVSFLGEAAGARVRCAISREALEDHFQADGLDKEGRLEKFREHRTEIERIARAKYLYWPVEEPEAVLIKTADVPELIRQAGGPQHPAERGQSMRASRKR